MAMITNVYIHSYQYNGLEQDEEHFERVEKVISEISRK